ncbi:MAG: aerobic carbon-monoxide dehydrogenase small subunit [Burkholderiales bacterium]|jgi:carbon-monoxide dehydrogenase small subunit
MSDIRQITLKVNGVDHTRDVETRMHLGDFLREELGLTGTHLGCEHGVCGACTVLVDGEAVRSCITYAVQLDGREVTTVEGLASKDGTLHPVQQAFCDHHGLQCGFCTPGMMISVVAWLKEFPDSSEGQIREAISGNICRCTGYQGIVNAAMDAAKKMREEV